VGRHIHRRTHTTFLSRTAHSIVMGVRFNQLVWTKYFDQAWKATPTHEKLTWILFLSNTLGILTLLEILVFK
jgi:hypothetical protein